MNQTRSDWIIRPYQPGDEADLVDLFRRVFGRSITTAHWQWKLKQLPSPVENVWLAVHAAKPIFQYAGIPLRYRVLTGERIGMVSVDTMTAPEFQRRGLLTQVGHQAYDSWQAAGVPFVIGLPNQRWGSRANALGWIDLFPLQWLVRPLRPEALLARRLKMHPLTHLTLIASAWNRAWTRRLQHDTSIKIRSVTQAGPEFDQLWCLLEDDVPISLVRDSAWVNWRYLNAPAFDYHVALAERSGHPTGYVVYRWDADLDRRVGVIAEVLAPRSEARTRDELIRAALIALQTAGAELVVALAVPGTALWQTFRRAGFWPRAQFGVQLVPLDPQLPIEQLRDPHQWNLSGGDFDVI